MNRSPPPAPSSPPPRAPSDDLFDWGLVRDWAGFVLRAPLRHKAMSALAFLLVAAAAVVSVKVLPFKWQVEASVLALPNPLMGALSNPGMNREWDSPTRAAREAVIRRDNLVAMCKQTNFPTRYLATRAPAVRARDWLKAKLTRKERTEEQVRDDLVDTLEERLWIVSHEGTVTITFQWSDPDLALHLVQAALDSFLEERYASEINAVGETIAILEGHDARVQREIATTIDQLEEKERELRITSGPRRSPVRARVAHDEDVTRIESVLAARRRALSELEDFRRRRLGDLQAQLSQQLTIYAPQHPEILGTRQAIESMSAPSPQIGAMRAEVEDLERELRARGGRPLPAAGPDPVNLAEARLRMESEDPRLEYERRQLQLLLRQHANLLERIDSARVEMDTAAAGFKYRYSVITPPQVPKKPVRPYAAMIALAGLVGGLAFAFFVAVALDLRSRRVVEAWQLERGLDLPVLAELGR